MATNQGADFLGLEDENRAIWNANAEWWDNRIGDGNDFQTVLIEPATERLLAVRPGDTILDIACGAGRFARRMAELGASVVAFDGAERFIQRARQRTPQGTAIEYHVLDAANPAALLALGEGRFTKAVCTMALMDMPAVEPLFQTLPRLLAPAGMFVFSQMHPCFNTAGMEMYCERYDGPDGRQVTHNGVKVYSYRSPRAFKGEGIVGQPVPQYYFHRPLHVLFGAAFRAGFALDGMQEPGFPPPDRPRPGVRWDDMPEIPPVLVARMRMTSRPDKP